MPAKASVLNNELVLTRYFAAPPALVFQCWTNPEHLKHWQGAPRGFTVTTKESDIRPGGKFRICMRSPEGVDHWLQGSYRDVVAPERLVFTHCWLNPDGKPGQETLVTITFTERQGQTELTLRQTGFKSVEARDGHEIGWSSALDVLAEYTATLVDTSKREMVVTRTLRAPRALVFKAFSNPEHLGHWWGPNGFTTTTFSMDFKPGGVWRYVMHGPDGRDYQNKVTYHEIVEPERIVFSHGGGEDDLEGVSHHTTITLVEQDGKTTVTLKGLFVTAEERERVIREYGALEGGKQTLARLDEYVAQQLSKQT